MSAAANGQGHVIHVSREEHDDLRSLVLAMRADLKRIEEKLDHTYATSRDTGQAVDTILARMKLDDGDAE